eukprot:TRINITY_DN4760_c0_g3_i1.p1 TRINITY_DN4760_c0_g3~~TRINITY_DN4760_c0_g3_i1.p1  ORF type:complete len:531 (-),score=82.80 TRINITY_DN4760_c0_g3_i1:91-1566(-)
MYNTPNIPLNTYSTCFPNHTILPTQNQPCALNPYLSLLNPYLLNQLANQLIQVPHQTPFIDATKQPSPTNAFVFTANSVKGANTTEPILTREQKIEIYRKKRSKRNFARQVDKERSLSAQARARDEHGKFLPKDCKSESNILELQSKLNVSEQECHSLKLSLSQRDKEIEEIKRQMEELMIHNEIQQERLKIIELQKTQGCPYDINTIREFKMKLQYLQQLEAAFSEREKQQSKSQEGNIRSDAASHGVQNDSIDDDKSDSHIQSSSAINQTQLDDSSPYRTMGSPTSDSEFLTSKIEMESPESLIAGRSRKKLYDVGAYYMYDPSWNGSIAAPFREKIDFSKISLRPWGMPPTFVDKARVEHFEQQRQWEKQQIEVNNLNQNHPDLQRTSYLHTVNSPCTPLFTEKIDFKDQLSKLRKTPMGPVLFGAQEGDRNTSSISPINQQNFSVNDCNLMSENSNLSQVTSSTEMEISPGFIDWLTDNNIDFGISP